VSRIAGGDWTSSVPAWCTFDVRIALYPGMRLADARAEVEATVRDAASRDRYLSNQPPEVHYHGFQAEGYVARGHEGARSLLADCHRAASGGELRDLHLVATTDARFFGLYAGIPALVYVPVAENIHGFDERVNIESIRRVTRCLALFVAAWCGLEPRRAAALAGSRAG
jgi:acetylornithine deacetylase